MLLAGLTALAAVAGCSSRQSVPRDPADVPGYLNAPADLAVCDPSPLRGRRILLDPGHGGFFRGAVGDDGLTEAEVNLGVALYLRGMLEWAGAEVAMTRTADVDFLSPADSSLTSDLAARVALADSLLPDVFVSVHHNSTAARDPDINETQTYYPLGREGADLDLARSIHRQLVRALEIEPAKILPGGFHVLRNSPVPAVLGEPAMISNPVISGRLSLARSLELEASAYFLGLRDYFAGGMPVWVSDLPDTLTGRDRHIELQWRFDPGGPEAPTLDPATVMVSLDGVPIGFNLAADGQHIQIAGTDLGEGGLLRIHGRNLAGRAAPDLAHACRAIDDGPWRSAFLAENESLPYRGLFTYAGGGLPLDSFGPLVLTLPGAADQAIALPVFPGRRGWLRLDPAPADLFERVIARRSELDVLAYFDASSPTVVVLPESTTMVHLLAPTDPWSASPVPGGSWRSRIPVEPALAAHFASDWPVFARRAGAPLWLEADGALPLVRPGLADVPPGGAIASAGDTLTWLPLLPGLVGRRVALDPRGGGTEDQGLGPLGARGSDLNLQVAGRLAALLRGAGCQVSLLREAEIFTPDSERVRRADAFGADLYLAIGRGEPGVRHHHGSSFGTPWAASCAGAIAAIIPDTVVVTAAWDYVLRHTACPAIMVELEAPSTLAVESRVTDPAWQDAMARALFRGTVAMLQPDAPFAAVPELVAALGDGALAADRLDLVRVDGNFSWLPPSGHVTAAPLPSWGADDPGLPVRGDQHVIELRAGPHWQLWALDRSAGGNWHGRILLENR